MSRTDETTQRENRKLIAVHLKNADKYLKAREFERAGEEVNCALTLEPTNEYVQAYKERILELRHGAENQSAGQREAVTVPRETPKKKRIKRGEDRKHREDGERRWIDDLAREEAREKQLAAYLEQAEEFLQKREFDKARISAERAFALNPRDQRTPNLYTRIREGRVAARQRKVGEEVRRQEVQKRIQTYVERATNYLVTGKLEKALDEVSEATSIDPRNAELNRLGERVREAIEGRQRAKEEVARRKLEGEAQRRREEEERRQREEEARLQAEEEARRRAQQERIAELLERAREHLAREKFKKALDEVENVFRLSPNHVEAVHLRETILLREEEKRRAEEEARRRAEEEERRRKEEGERLRLERKVRGFIQSAEVYFTKGRFEKALTELNNAYILDPSNTDIKHFVEKIEREIEERRRVEEAEERKRLEEARRRLEEEALRKREEEEQRRRQEEERRLAEEVLKRRAKLMRVHEYLAKALDELATARAIDQLNPLVAELENAVRETIEKADRTFPSEQVSGFVSTPHKPTPGELRVTEAHVRAALLLRESAAKTQRPAYVLRKSKTRKKFLVGVALVAVLAIVGFILSPQLGFLSERKVLLVMPFRLSPDNPQEAYLSDAIMMGMISDFSAVPSLSVFNEGTAYVLRQSNDAVAAAKRVHATHVLHGTISREGGRLVVDTKLSEVLTGKSIWTKEVSAPTLDFVVVRNSIFDGVLEALGVHGQVAKPSWKGLTNDPEALDFYWRGRADLLGSREEDFHRAIDAFDEALSRDTRFALALAGKAAAALSLYERDSESDPQWLDRAKEFSKQALRISDEIELAHCTLGSALVCEEDYTKAIEEIQKALSLEPSDASAYRTIALVYAAMGDQKDAAKASATALDLDPLNFQSFLALGIAKHLEGDYAGASAAYERAIALEPGIAWGVMGLLDNALLAQGVYQRALSLYENYLHLHPGDYEVLYKVGRAYQLDGQIHAAQPYFTQVIDLTQRELRRDSKSARAYIYMALAQTRMGKYSQARGSAKRAMEIAPKDPIALYGIAYMFSMQNESAAAVEWLRKAVSTRFSYQQVLDVDLLNVKTDLAFGEILHTNS
jgi:tetratricopeptide (TPR) repeat protein